MPPSSGDIIHSANTCFDKGLERVWNYDDAETECADSDNNIAQYASKCCGGGTSVCQEFVSPLCAVESDFDGSATYSHSCYKMFDVEADRDAECSNSGSKFVSDGQFYCYYSDQAQSDAACNAWFPSGTFQRIRLL